MENTFAKIRSQMDKIISALNGELRTLHTGKASTVLVESVLIDYYGTKVPLKQLAQITTPQANQIVIIPWDKAALKDIETSIRNSDLGINPVAESNQIRLILLPLSEERRRELTKVIHSKSEQAKISIRNIRREVWDEIQKMEKNSQITEDDKYQGKEDLDKIIEEYNSKIDKIAETKTAEIMKV